MRAIYRTSISVSLLLLYLCLFLPPAHSDSRPFLVEGRSLYLKGEYLESKQAFLKSVQLEPEDGVAWFNLGNTEFRNGEIGRAVFSYKMAEKFLPRDPDVNFNLNYVRSKRQDQIKAKKSVSTVINSLMSGLTDKEGLLGFAFFLTLLLVFSVLFVLKHSKIVAFFRVFTLVFSLTFSSYLIKGLFFESDFGVVVSEQVNVTSGMDKNSVALFQLHAGSEFKVLEFSQGKDWCRIRIADGKMGWLRVEDAVLTM